MQADNRTQVKWYLRPSVIIIAFLILGPLAIVLIPFVWRSPSFKLPHKIALIIIILLYTGINIWALRAFAGIVEILQKQIQDLQGAIK